MQLKNAFLKTMDNNRGNDGRAHRDIARLASGMSTGQIEMAYRSAQSEACRENSKKGNGIFSPYKNVGSCSDISGYQTAHRANDWMAMYPGVPHSVWGFCDFCGW